MRTASSLFVLSLLLISPAARGGELEDLVARSESLSQQGHDEAALVPLRDALRLAPNDLQLNRRYTDLMMRTGRGAEVAEEYRARRERRPQDPDAHYLFGRSSGDLAVARVEFDECLRLQPEHVWCLQGMAGVDAAEGKLDAAAQGYARALELRPDLAEVHNKAANLHLARGEREAAFTEWRAAIAADPTDYHAYMNMGAVMSGEGDLEGAAALLKQGVERAPANPLAHTNYGYILFKLQRFEEAEAHFAVALAINPRDRAVAGSRDLVRRVRAGEIPFAAYAPYEEALTAQMTDPARAVQKYGEVLLLAPDFGTAHMNLGLAHVALGDAEAGLRSLRKAVELQPEDPAALFNLGYLLLGMGELTEARTWLDKAYQADPEDIGVLNALAIAALGQRDADEAILWYRRALDLLPRDPRLWFELGSAQAASARFDDAVGSLRRALELAPGFVDARVQLVAVLREARRFDDALAELTRLEELAPGNADLKAQRAALEAARAQRRKLDASGGVHVAQIIVRDAALAQDLRQRLVDGADFAALAREHSVGAEGIHGGDVGRVQPADLRPEIATALATLAPGELSEVLDLGGVFLLVKRIE